MNQEPLPLSAVPGSNSRSGLIAFGIMTICLGLLSLLCVLFSFLGQVLGPETGRAFQFTPLIVYGSVAVMFIWLGIGSILARRWARALLVIISGGTLVFGVLFTSAIVALWGPILAWVQTLRPGKPPISDSLSGAILGGIGIGMTFSLIILPAIWMYFYSRASVKAACEACNPAPSWTDSCPLPVLAVSVWMLIGSHSFVKTAFSAHATCHFFGTFASGVWGGFVYFCMLVLWLFAAWSLYRRTSGAWWIALGAVCISPISALITFSRHESLEMFRIQGLSEAQLARLGRFVLFQDHNFLWFILVSSLPWIIYLLIIKRYFKSQPAQPAGEISSL